MRRLIEGTLDIGLMYTPGHGPGLVVEHLFDETLVLVSSRADEGTPGEDYIYVERGPGFHHQHARSYPDQGRPPQIVNIGWLGVQLVLANGGSCFLSARMAEPLIASGRRGTGSRVRRHTCIPPTWSTRAREAACWNRLCGECGSRPAGSTTTCHESGTACRS
jgi:DNA-binding transcriptional LysR family regulator